MLDADVFFNRRRNQLVALAAQYRIPTSYQASVYAAPAVSPVMVMTAWNRAAIELSGMELHEGVNKYRG